MFLKDAFTIRPWEVKPGDVFAFTITCHVVDETTLRFYRCPYTSQGDLYDDEGNVIPQGMRLPDFANVQDIFPTMFVYKTMNSEGELK